MNLATLLRNEAHRRALSCLNFPDPGPEPRRTERLELEARIRAAAAERTALVERRCRAACAIKRFDGLSTWVHPTFRTDVAEEPEEARDD